MKRISKEKNTIEQIDLDSESAFLSNKFQTVLKNDKIVNYLADSKLSARIVERFNRTFRNLYARYKPTFNEYN